MATLERLLNSPATQRDLLWTLLQLQGGPNVNILRCPFRPSTRDLLYTLIKATQDAPAAGGIAIPDGVYTTGLGVSQDGKVTIAGGELTAIQEAQP